MVAPVIIAAGIVARYGAKKLMKHLTKQALKKSKSKASVKKIKKENRKYGDPELNAKGNQVMSKAYKSHSKNSPDNHDFPSGMIKETLPKKFFKNPMKHDGFAAGEKSARKYVKEMDAKLKKSGMKKLVKHGYSLKDMEF
jgi:hypothetical protein